MQNLLNKKLSKNPSNIQFTKYTQQITNKFTNAISQTIILDFKYLKSFDSFDIKKRTNNFNAYFFFARNT